MWTKAFSLIAMMFLCACATPSTRGPASEDEIARPQPTDNSSVAEKTCEPSASVHKMLNIMRTQTSNNREDFMKALQQAFANCPGIENLYPGPAGMAALANKGWTCKQTTEFFTEPKNALVFIGDAVELSRPIEDGTICYNRDFRERYCRPAQGYTHEDQPMHGWCAYIPSNS